MTVPMDGSRNSGLLWAAPTDTGIYFARFNNYVRKADLRKGY